MSEPTTPTGKALRQLLPGLDSLLVLDASTFGPIIASRPDVWDIIRAFLVSGIPQVEHEAREQGAREERERLRALMVPDDLYPCPDCTGEPEKCIDLARVLALLAEPDHE